MIHKSSTARKAINLAVIGMGNRAAHMSNLMHQADSDVRVAAIVDPDQAGARQRMSSWNVPQDDRQLFYDSLEALLQRADDLDGIVIGTQCHLHTPVAVAVAALGLPVFLEKPAAISWDQLHKLRRAYRGREDSVVVSFPLRVTIHARTAMEIIRSGRLGTINQIQAVNNVPYGGVYFGQWYRSYEKTGGLWLQKATHDFDYITQLMNSVPTMIAAMHSRMIFGGDMPADLTCARCDVADECPESPAQLTIRGEDGGMLNGATPTPASDHACAFSSSIKHQDCGSAIVMYASGAHASYVQNFVPRRSAALRGATIIGYKATLRFNWQSDTIHIVDHHRDRVDEITVKSSGFHGGGDQMLAQNFVDLLRGRDTSHSPLTDGLLSTAMCLAARDSAALKSFQPIAFSESESDSIMHAHHRPHTGRNPVEPPDDTAPDCSDGPGPAEDRKCLASLSEQ
jgi:predicted dehydrogenase